MATQRDNALGAKRFCLLGATFTTGNMGVAALTMGALRCIYETFPRAEVLLLDYDRQSRTDTCVVSGRTRRIRLINLRFSARFWLPNNILVLLLWTLLTAAVLPAALRRVLRRLNPWLGDILDCEFCYAISGGDSFSDIYGIERFFYVALPQLLCLWLGKPLVQLPQTLGPFENPLVKSVAAYVLRRSAAVYSRDEEGVAIARRLMGAKRAAGRARFSPDVAFVMEPREPPEYHPVFRREQSRGRPLVGVNVSGLLWMGGYRGDNRFGLRFSYQEFMRLLVEQFIIDLGVSVALIPHVFADGPNPEADPPACAALAAAIGLGAGERLVYDARSYSQSELKYLIGSCDFMIGGRMHACIAALSQGVPAVGIAYSRKFAGVLQSIDAGALVVDPRAVTQEQALEACIRHFGHREQWKSHLVRILPSVRQRVLAVVPDSLLS